MGNLRKLLKRKAPFEITSLYIIMSSNKSILTLVLVTLAIAAQAFKCPQPQTKPDFDVTRYLGNWYQVEGTTTFFLPKGTTCVRATYGAKDDGSVSVHNVCTKVSGELSEVCGYAKVIDPKVPGKLAVYFPQAPVPGDYQVLDTDYENYAAVYSCASILGVFKYETTYVLQRSQSRNQTAIDEAKAAYERNNISTDNFVRFESGPNCKYDIEDSCDKNQ